MTEPSTTAFRPRRVALLGGGGFIGAWACERLLAKGVEVRVLERSGVKPWRSFDRNECIEWRTGDAGSLADLKAVLAGVDAVVHLASATLPGSGPDELALELERDRRALACLLEALPALQIPRLVFVSSGGCVYGPARRLPIDEDHPTRPVNDYGSGKLAAEAQMLEAAQRGRFDVKILRVANAYGARQRLDHRQGVVTTFLHRARQGLPLIVYGDGSVLRDFVHVSDVAEAIACALGHTGASQTFNIGSGQATRIDALIERIERLLERPVLTEFYPGRPGDVEANALDCGRARAELGWQPRVALAAGLEMTLAWIDEVGGAPAKTAIP